MADGNTSSFELEIENKFIDEWSHFLSSYMDKGSDNYNMFLNKDMIGNVYTVLKSYPSNIDLELKKFKESIEGISNIGDVIKEQCVDLDVDILSSISSLEFLNSIMNLYNSPFEVVSSGVKDAIEKLSRYISDNTWVDETNWREKQKIMRKWGHCGWTLHPEMCLSDFANMPLSKEDADNSMSFCLKNEYVDSLIEYIRQEDFVNMIIFDECVEGFFNGLYSICALGLCSLIEGVMIEYNEGEIGVKKRQRASDIKSIIDNQKLSVRTVVVERITNTLACFYKFNEPRSGDSVYDNAIFNRNVISHGFRKEKVTKKECVQLMLLYWNMGTMINALKYV